MVHHKKYLALALAFALLFLGACQRELTPAGHPEKKRMVNVALAHAPVSLNPMETMDPISHFVAAPLYHRLFTTNENGNLVPYAVASWEHKEVNSYVFTLRDDLVFHNGDPLRAQDVVYTLKCLIDSPLWGHLFYTVDRDSIVAQGDLTVSLQTTEPTPYLTTLLAHPVSSILDSRLGEKHNYTQEPIGSGPYRLNQWKLGSFIQYDLVDTYQADSQNDGLIYWTIPDETERIGAIESGQIEVMGSGEKRPQINANWRLDESPTFYALGIHLHNAPMGDPVLREALQFLLGPEELATDTHGLAHGGLLPWYAAYSDTNDLTGYQDRETGFRLLKESGYDDITLTLALEKDAPIMEKLCEALIKQLSGYGLTIEPVYYPPEAYEEALRSGEEHLFIQEVTMQIDDPAPMLAMNFYTDRLDTTHNYTQLSDPQVNELITQAAHEMNPEVRRQRYGDLQTLMAQIRPWLIIWEPAHYYAIYPSLVIPDTTGSMLHPERWTWRE